MPQHEKKFSLRQDIALARAVADAGFTLTDSRLVSIHGWSCWQATLTHGNVNIVTVSNDGDDRPTESHFHAAAGVQKILDKTSLDKLFAIREVATAVRLHMQSTLNVSAESSEMSEPIHFTAQAETAICVPLPTKENIEFLVGHLIQVYKIFNSFKYLTETKLVVVFEGGDETGAYMVYKVADTPENRARVIAQANRKIDYFVSDLLGTGSQRVPDQHCSVHAAALSASLLDIHASTTEQLGRA